MKEVYYIKVNEFKPNDYIYGSMLVFDNKPFTYDIGSVKGTREEVLLYATKRTIIRSSLENSSFQFKYQSLEDVKMMRKHLQEDPFFAGREIEMTPAVFTSDEYNNELLTDILNKHSLQRRMFNLHNYENE